MTLQQVIKIIIALTLLQISHEQNIFQNCVQSRCEHVYNPTTLLPTGPPGLFYGTIIAYTGYAGNPKDDICQTAASLLQSINMTCMDYFCNMNTRTPYYIEKGDVDSHTALENYCQYCGKDEKFSLVRQNKTECPHFNFNEHVCGEGGKALKVNKWEGYEPDYFCVCEHLNPRVFHYRCDAYARFWTPLAQIGFTIIFIVLYFCLFFVYVPLVSIPIIRVHWRIYKSQMGTWKDLFSLKMQCMILQACGLFILGLSHVFGLSTGVYHIMQTAAFRAAGHVLLCIGLVPMLVLWIHTCDTSESLNNDKPVSFKLILFYILFVIGVVLYVILVLIFVLINFFTGMLAKEQHIVGFFISSIILLILAIGYLVYGTRMYILLTKINSSVRFEKLKFTRFMLGLAVIFTLSTLILLLKGIFGGFGLPYDALSPFFFLYSFPAIDLLMWIMHIILLALLFDEKQFKYAYHNVFQYFVKK